MEVTNKDLIYSRSVEENAVDELADALASISFGKKEIVIVCVGTDRSTGDSLGPLVGTHIENKVAKHVHVYGTLDEPVHGANLPERMDYINKKHRSALIIGVDASLGTSSRIGMITLQNKHLSPGEGVKRTDLPKVGDYSIVGIVNVSGIMEYFVLQNTRLSFVMKISNVISEAILKVFSKENVLFNNKINTIEFVNKQKEDMLVDMGWEKKLHEFTTVPISDVYKDGIRGNQMWERWVGKIKQELYIMYSEDQSHPCTLYYGGTEGVEFSLRNLKSNLKKHA